MTLWRPKCSQPAPVLLMLTAATALLAVPSALGGSTDEEEEVVRPMLEFAKGNETRYLSLDAFGLQLRLELKRDHGFLAPSFTLQTVGYRPGLEVLFSQTVGDLEHCFYSGTVNGDPESTAALSLCQGVNGIFHLQNKVFFIQPAPGNDTEPLVPLEAENVQPQQLQFHVLRRKREGGGGNFGCGVVNDESRPTGSPKPESEDTRTQESQQDWEAGITGQPTETAGMKKRRAVTRPHYVETMLVADKSMVDFYGSRLQHYLLTLFSVTSRLYKHSTTYNLINLVVVRILVLSDEDNGLNVTSDASVTLENFCNWQRQHNLPSDHDAGHYDTTILFTRKDICFPYTCGIVGIANIGTMCDPNYSCSLVEDFGLPTALTTAHELGHVFGMYHDNAQECARYSIANPDSHIMAAKFPNVDSPIWSHCSAYFLRESLQYNRAECLWDVPQESITPVSRLPGTVYDVHLQCQFLLGNSSEHCPDPPNACKVLWCTAPFGGKMLCQKQAGRWADGTSCGDEKWCISGQCVNVMDKDHFDVPVDGGWGSWTPWQNCRNTCGGGLQYRTRGCHNPEPKFGGNYCIGERV